jgi:hypothetical protein
MVAERFAEAPSRSPSVPGGLIAAAKLCLVVDRMVLTDVWPTV